MSEKISIPDELPPGLTGIYTTLYTKIERLIDGQEVIDIKADPTLIRIMIGSAMEVVEGYGGWTGAEKKRYALMMIQFIIADLADKGKIDKDVAREINANIDFWGGIVMDVAIDAIKKAFDIGQDFVQDARRQGCGPACKENCTIV